MYRQGLAKGKKIVDAQSLSASWNSDAVDVNTTNIVGMIYTTSGVTTNTGNFKIQVRILKDANSYSDWADLSSDLTVTLAGANISPTFLNLNQLPPVQLRIVYTKAGTSAGTFTAWLSGGQS